MTAKHTISLNNKWMPSLIHLGFGVNVLSSDSLNKRHSLKGGKVMLLVGDAIRFVKKLADGVNITKIGIVGKGKMKSASGTIEVDAPSFDLKLNGTYNDGSANHTIEAVHPRNDTNNVVKIDGVEKDDADIDLHFVKHFPPQLKVVLQYNEGGQAKEIWVYANLG